MKRTLFVSLLVFIATVMLIAACAPTSATEEPVGETSVGQATQVEQATEAPSVTSQAATEAPATQPATEAATETGAGQPVVGGTVVLADTNEPDTLDIQKSSYGITSWVTSYFGGAMLATNTDGEYVPYIAESWSANEDGTVWEFKIKDGVTFHNGDPLTAQDWVYTIERAQTPTPAHRFPPRWWNRS